MQNFVIGIVGAGPVGLVIALGLRAMGYKVELIDPQGTSPAHPHRTLVLNNNTLRILLQLGVDVRSQSYAKVLSKVLLQTFGSTRHSIIDSRHQSYRNIGEGFGVSISQHSLYQLVYQQLIHSQKKHQQVEIFQGKVMSFCYPHQSSIRVDIKKQDNHILSRDYALLVVADGSFSQTLAFAGIDSKVTHTTQHVHIGKLGYLSIASMYGIANKGNQAHHSDCAFEIFDSCNDITTVVVPTVNSTEASNQATTIVIAPKHFAPPTATWFYQRITPWCMLLDHTHLTSYPVIETQANELVRPRLAVLGNAACTLHPLAAQGLNLAYQQSAHLFQSIRDAENSVDRQQCSWDDQSGQKSSIDPGQWHILRSFEAKAKAQQRKVQTLVGTLRRISHASHVLNTAIFASHLPFARRLLVKMVGG